MSWTKEYDKETGQVFNERLISGASRSQIAWHKRCRKPLPSRRPSARGPRSLVTIALVILAENFDLLEDGALDQVPDRLLWRIWDSFKDRAVVTGSHDDHGRMTESSSCLSFHIWKTLAPRLFKALRLGRKGDGSCELMRYREEIKFLDPTVAFLTYIRPMVSSSLEFLVHLAIGEGVSFSSHELLNLTDLKNLAVLEIIQPDSGRESFPRVSDRLVRQWSEVEGAFPVLRVLRLWGEDFTTDKSLEYVSLFPALIVYDVAGKAEDWLNEPSVPGWTCEGDLWLRHRLGARFYPAMTSLAQYLTAFGRSGSRERQAELARMLGEFSKTLKEPEDHAVDILARDQVPPFPNNDRRVWWHDARHFNDWGFLLYSEFGKLLADQDLMAQGIPVEKAIVVDKYFVMPPLPCASISLGVPPSVFFDAHLAFLRRQPPRNPQHADDRSPETRKRRRNTGAESTDRPTVSRHRKKMAAQDLLSAFNGT